MELLAAYIEELLPSFGIRKPTGWYDATFSNYEKSVKAYVDVISSRVTSDMEPIYQMGSMMPVAHTRRSRIANHTLHVIFKSQADFDQFFQFIGYGEFQLQIESIVYNYCRILNAPEYLVNQDYIVMEIRAMN